MKRIITIIATIVLSCTLFAQNDTIPLKGECHFTKEDYISKSGEVKTYYYCEYKGETYASNKQSYERAKSYKRFNANYFAVMIQNKKSKRVVIL